VLDNLWPVLDTFGLSGRIYYVGTCDSHDRYIPPAFPKVTLRQSANAAGGIVAAKDIFSNDPNVRVSGEIADKVVRVWIGKVPKALLDTKISIVRFQPLDQYNPARAIAVIEDTREVQRAMDKIDVHEMPIPFERALVLPRTGLPHLPPYLTNITLDQALDLVATTFSGVVIYGECFQHNLLHISVYKRPFYAIGKPQSP
jgi:hypothetical protein